MSKFPSMMWHPETGEPKMFQNESEVPEGYLDHHPNDPQAVKQPEVVETTTPAALPMTREEIVKELTDGGIQFKKNAKTDALYDVLMTALKAHLAASEIEFPEIATGPELLALVPKPE